MDLGGQVVLFHGSRLLAMVVKSWVAVFLAQVGA
jgi:hypothetical protein